MPESQFIDPLMSGIFDINGRNFYLLSRFRYVTKINPLDFGYSVELPTYEDGWLIEIPKGFVTDFASTPRILWSILPPIGRVSFPAAIHDYLYIHHVEGRKWADEVFKEAMVAAGLPRWNAWIYWAGVRVVARKYWAGQ